MIQPRVLIADDHVIFSQGLQSLLQDEFDIVGSVTNGQELIAAAKNFRPDVIVADISMPVLNGLAAVRQMRREGDNTKVVFLTMHAEAEIVLEAFRAGATGYVLKQSAGEELIAAIHASLVNRTYLTPLVTKEVLQLLLDPRLPLQEPTAYLSPKWEILQMLAEGHSLDEMARALHLSAGEIEADRAEMMRAFGVQTTAEFVRLACQMGLVTVTALRAQ